MTKHFSKIWIIVILVLLAGGFFACPPKFLKEKFERAWQYFGTEKEEVKDETANWKTYRNEEYGFEFKYPQGWIFAAQPTGGIYDILDIHLANFQHSDSPTCDPNFIGLEIQVGNLKDPNQDFSSFVKSQIVESGLGPRGSLEEIKTDNHLGFKVQYSGWDISCSGPGYFIEQDKNYFTYIFTGAHQDNQKEGLEKVNQMLSTFRFFTEKERIKEFFPDWKTYRSEEYWFEIKYPSNFFTEDKTNGIYFINEQWRGQMVHYPLIGIEFIKTSLTPQQWVAEKGTEFSLVEVSPVEKPPGFQFSKYQYFGVKDKITKTIGTLQVFQFYSSGVSAGVDHTLIQQKGDALIDIYRHSSGMGEISKDIYNQMLSTFRFLPPR